VFIALWRCRRAPLRNPETGAIIGSSPFMSSLIVSISLLFLVSASRMARRRHHESVNDVVTAMTTRSRARAV
jgi:aminobenzoyl-glutamate transport protein